MQSRLSGTTPQQLRSLGFALAIVAAPLFILAQGSGAVVALDSPRKGEAPATAAEALEDALTALSQQSDERLAKRLVEEQRDSINGRYGRALLESLILHEWLEPRVSIDGNAGRAWVRWKARFQTEQFVQTLLERGPQAKADGEGSSAEELTGLARRLAERLEPQRQTFRLVRSSRGWHVALPETWLGLIEQYEFPESHARGESAYEAATAVLEAYRTGDAAALTERSVPSERNSFAPIARALLDSVHVRTYEVIAAAEGPRRAKVTYRWVTKINLPAFVRSVKQSLPTDESEESESVRQTFRDLAAQHGAAYLDARQRPRQSMLLKKLDGRWYLERIMAESVTDSLTFEGSTSPELAAEKVAEAMVKAHHERMIHMFPPQRRTRYWEQFQPILEALVIDGYEVYRVDDVEGSEESVARVIWNSHFDVDAFVAVAKDITREQLLAQGMSASRIERQIEHTEQQARARALQLEAILTEPRALVVMREVDERWFLIRIASEMAPPEDEVGFTLPAIPWPVETQAH